MMIYLVLAIFNALLWSGLCYLIARSPTIAVGVFMVAFFGSLFGFSLCVSAARRQENHDDY